MLKNYINLVMNFDNIIFDVIEEWKDDLTTIIGVSAAAKDDAREITTFIYESNYFSLLEDGCIYRVEIQTTENGYTWNGDDMYVKSYSRIVNYLEKIGQIEINNLDYSIDENIEIVACNLIEFMRDHTNLP